MAKQTITSYTKKELSVDRVDSDGSAFVEIASGDKRTYVGISSADARKVAGWLTGEKFCAVGVVEANGGELPQIDVPQVATARRRILPDDGSTLRVEVIDDGRREIQFPDDGWSFTLSEEQWDVVQEAAFEGVDIENRQLRDANTRLRDEIANLRHSREMADQRADRSMKHEEVLRTDLSLAKANLRARDEKISRLEVDLTNSKDAYEHMRKEHNNRVDERQALKYEVQALHRDKAALKKELRHAEWMGVHDMLNPMDEEVQLIQDARDNGLPVEKVNRFNAACRAIAIHALDTLNKGVE
jgi:hypothetical protein